MTEKWKPLYYCGSEGYDTLLHTLQPKVAFDLGANKGGFIQKMLDAGVEEVHAFEPVPDMCQQLRDAFGKDERVIINELGISDKPETLKAVLPTFAWALLPAGKGAVAAAYVDKPRFDVQCTTVDDYITKTGVVPDFLKVDVDGYEIEVLKGARTLLEFKGPWMLFELSDLMRHRERTVEELCCLIYMSGYRAVSLDLSYSCPDALTLMGHFPYNSSYDVFLLPKEMKL